MKLFKHAMRWCADHFSLARLLMGIVAVTLCFAVYAQIVTQQIDEGYELKVLQPKDFKPATPNMRL